MTAEDRKKLFAVNAAGPPLVFLVGPKAIGKTLFMMALPSLLKADGTAFKDGLPKALFVEIVGAGGSRVEEEVFKALRAMVPGNPSRPDGEDRFDYIRDCTRGAMILLDVRRKMNYPLKMEDKAWASDITEQVRILWEHAKVPVVVCTSEGKDIVEAKDEPRRHILCFPELSRETSMAYMKKLLGFSQGAALPDWCVQCMEVRSRNFKALRRHAARGRPSIKEDLDAIVMTDVGHIDRLLINAKCPDSPDFLKQLAKNEAVRVKAVVKQCHGNEGAPAILVAANLLRPALTKDERGGPDATPICANMITWSTPCS